MTPENFCYWLKSAFELCNAKSFDEKQTEMIKNHLNLVFTNVTSVAEYKEDIQNILDK